MDRQQRRHEDEVRHLQDALIAKDAREFRDIQLVRTTKPERKEKESPLIETEDMTDEEFFEHILVKE